MESRLVFLRVVVDSIHHAHHHVRRNNVGTLAAHVVTRLGVFHMFKLPQNVESLEHNHKFVVQEGAHQPGIPYQVIGVQLAACVFPAGIEVDVVSQVEMPRQMQMCQQSHLPVDRMRHGTTVVGVRLSEP